MHPFRRPITTIFVLAACCLAVSSASGQDIRRRSIWSSALSKDRLLIGQDPRTWSRFVGTALHFFLEGHARLSE